VAAQYFKTRIRYLFFLSTQESGMPSISSLFSCIGCSSALQVFEPQHDKVVTHLTWQEAARILEAEQRNKLSPVLEGVEVQTPNPGKDNLSACSGLALPEKRVADDASHARPSSQSEIGLESITIFDSLEQSRPPSLTILGFLEEMNMSSPARAEQLAQECNATSLHPFCPDAAAHGGYA
jgi:hypothetical protein